MQKQLYTSTNEALIEWLKQERKKKGLSLRQVGELIGRHHSIVGNIETQVRRMDVPEFYEYCRLLELNPHDCFDFIEKKLSHSKP